MSHFKHHVFFCCNQREAGQSCCNAHGASELQTHAKDRTVALGLRGRGSVRINKAGCLGRCDHGPVLVVYPDNVWYTYKDRQDIDEIIDSHLAQGRIVERLRLPEDAA